MKFHIQHEARHVSSILVQCSTHHISLNETLFNDTIRDVAIQELPRLDHTFTWSNMQSPPPPLVHSNNALWDDILPDFA
jgi:hypothetical protein